MSAAPTVVKVGGSLFEWPDLGARLGLWLRALNRREILLVPGGGAVGDFVRDMDRSHGLGAEQSHWLALASLRFTAQLLVNLVPPPPGLGMIDDLNERWDVWGRGNVPVLDLNAFAFDDDGTAGYLPHSWDVTSDSLAARVAEVMAARELILLKSVTIPPHMDWAEASRRGFVDGHFPTMIARGVKAHSVNLREWQP
jgi:5-(aminomethyl)-3-furanmethanol phosphate kinase